MKIDSVMPMDGRVIEIDVQQMFDNLSKHIGLEVVCNMWWHGNLFQEVGKLKEVNNFVNVLIGGKGIPFIGYGAAIIDIIADDGEILYQNPYLEENYARKSNEEIYRAKALIFGKEVARQQQISQETATDRYKEKVVQQAKKAQQNKCKFMSEGLEFIHPDMVEQWLEFVNINTDNGYSAAIVEAVISMMRKLNNGISYQEAEEQIYSGELGLTGYQIGEVANIVSTFYLEGEQYRQHWNAKFDITSDEKGTANPAVFTFGTRK